MVSPAASTAGPQHCFPVAADLLRIARQGGWEPSPAELEQAQTSITTGLQQAYERLLRQEALTSLDRAPVVEPEPTSPKSVPTPARELPVPAVPTTYAQVPGSWARGDRPPAPAVTTGVDGPSDAAPAVLAPLAPLPLDAEPSPVSLDVATPTLPVLTPPVLTPPVSTPPAETPPGSTPPDDSAEDEQRRPVYLLPELDIRRPTTLGPVTQTAPDPDAVWTDGARLPSYFFDRDLGLGHGEVVLRGHAEVLDGLQHLAAVDRGGRAAAARSDQQAEQTRPRLDLPEATWGEIKTALTEEPHSFLGDGRPFTVSQPGRAPFEVVIQARPRGNWDRFRDADGAAYRVENQTLRTADLKVDRSFGDSRRVAVAVPLGPGPGPHTGFGQVSVDVVGNEHSYAYAHGTSGLDQRETRISFPASVAGRGVSHVHVDDLDFSVRVYRPGREARELAGEGHFTVGGGLQVRVPDLITLPATVDVPKQLDIAGRVPDTYQIEQLGPVAPVFSAALDQFPELRIGSPGYQVLRHMISGRALTGSLAETVDGWGVLQEIPGSEDGAPAGAIRVRTRLGTAELLLTTDGQEMRVGRAAGARSETTMATTSGLQVSGLAGGSVSVPTGPVRLRVQAGVTASASWSWREAAMSGGTAARKRLAVSWGRNATYRVAVEYTLQRTGGQEVTVAGHVLIRLPEEEAIRLGNPPVSVVPPAGPTPPPYLAIDQPATLGLHSVRSLTGIPDLRERTIDALAARHPDLVAPWSELDPSHPRWRGHPHRHAVALRNTIQLSRFLSENAVTAATDTLISTGQRLRLNLYNVFTKEYVTIRLRAELSNRTYVGSEDGVGMRVFSSLGDRIDSTRREVRTGTVGVTANIRVQDRTGVVGGTVAATWRRVEQRTRTSGFGQAVSGEDLVIAPLGSHSFAYDVQYHLEEASFTRPRNAWRVATLDLLATENFVHQSGDWQPVLPAADRPATGTLVVRVPDALTKALDKPVAPPTRPDAGTGEGTDSRDWRGRVHVVVGVAGADRLNEAVNQQIAEAQEDSWLYTQPGATAHEVVQDSVTSDALNANFLRMATGGWTLGPLVAKRPVKDRVGAVRIESSVSNLHAVSGLFSDEMELDIDRQGEIRSSQVIGTATGHSAVMSASVGPKPTIDGTPVPGSYGAAVTLYERLRGQEQTSWLTGVHEIDPVYNGRFVLVTGDVTYTVQAQGRRTGRLVRKKGATVRRPETTVSVPDGVWMIVREDDAVAMGLIPAGPGPKPDYGSVTVPREFLSHPLGWSPENVPDAREAASLMRRWFAEQPEGRYAGLLPAEELEDLNNNLRHLQSATSTLGMSGLLSQMVADGVPIRLLEGTGHLPWTNKARLWIRVELGEPEFLEARHSHEIDEYPNSHVGAQKTQTLSRTRGGGLTVNEGTSFDDSSANLSATFTDAGAATTTSSRVEAKRTVDYRNTATNVNRPTASLAFPTKVILSVEEDGKVVHSVSAPGGTVVASVPWSLTVPSRRADGAIGESLRELRPDAPELDKPLTLPPNATIVDVGGVAAIRHAGTRSVAALEGEPHRAGRTPLTRTGNVAAEVQTNALSGPMLRSFFAQITGPTGLPLPQLTENFVTGGATARTTVRAQIDVGGAVLVSVSNDHRYDVGQRVGRTVALGGSLNDTHTSGLGVGPALTAGDPGAPDFTSGALGTDRMWAENQVDGQTTTIDQPQRTLVKPLYRRTFVFRFPVDWEFTTTGTRATMSGLAAGLAGKGPLPENMTELRVEKGVWIRLTEDQARAAGLITDDTFPAAVAKEWDAVADARAPWTRSDQTFRARRDDVSAAEASLSAARRSVAEAEAKLSEDPQDVQRIAALTAAQNAEDEAVRVATAATVALNEARSAAEAAAARYRELRASATAMTARYRTPAARRVDEPSRPPGPETPPSGPVDQLSTIVEVEEEADDTGEAIDRALASSRRAEFDPEHDVADADEWLARWRSIPDAPGTGVSVGGPIDGPADDIVLKALGMTLSGNSEDAERLLRTVHGLADERAKLAWIDRLASIEEEVGTDHADQINDLRAVLADCRL
ncbi:hypothetical protein [Micromonospora chokoriensis]|uniref:hypothetical protein n=1 Tax=Micromonospora chokoriensis TaxID=356851 RepID=UPI0004C38ED0|nr:hypothetical protein [Micromonospora chokoriensis]